MFHRIFVILFREKVDKFFNALDRDFDGRLSLEEFLGEETPIEKLFKLMDRNGDGYVTKKVYLVPSKLVFNYFEFQEFQTICKKLSKEQVGCQRRGKYFMTIMP